ncbi:unnamed protein product [Paramecium sonneborni]|uniref:C2H2-type domain-containing protein n=1 Tax=Paramecium sonneborni TaxID=65129 RepID=A0A8S1RC48_9CILI|nr:unnamed protein product [Paramecium sonneborni]
MFIPNTLRNNKFNLQSLQNLDFELMQRNNDLETLQSFIIPLQQGFTTEREFKDSLNTIKYLKLIYLIQMTLLYFEYTKQYQETTIDQIFKQEFLLDNEITSKESHLAQSKNHITKLKLKLSSANKEFKRIKQDASKNETVYACLYCTGKAFLSIPLLEAHYQRHHIDKFEKPKQNFQETLLTVQT